MLLHMCQQLANPFDNDIMSFPGLRYVKGIYLDFEILLGLVYFINGHGLVVGNNGKTRNKQRELNDLAHMAQDCGILHDEKRVQIIAKRKTESNICYVSHIFFASRKGVRTVIHINLGL
eukprot:915180_1